MKKVIGALFCVFMLASCLSGPGGQAGPTFYRQSRLHLGTMVHLKVAAGPQDGDRLERVFKRIWARFDHIYAVMSRDNPQSDVYRLNHSYPDPVPVDADTYAVIETALRMSRLTHGAFDITVYPLVSLWKYWQHQKSKPDHAAIRGLMSHVGGGLLRLIPPDRVQRLDPGTRIDLGGIAKGYAVDEAARIFRAEGFDDFYIEAGGDIYCGGVNPDGRPWRIGIRHPRQPRKIIDVLRLSDMAVTTSGDYERFYFVNQQRWSHIINPVTGYPQRGIASATVVAPRAMTADALSTALCVLPPRIGLPVIDRRGPGYAALLLRETATGELIRRASARYGKFADESRSFLW